MGIYLHDGLPTPHFHHSRKIILHVRKCSCSRKKSPTPLPCLQFYILLSSTFHFQHDWWILLYCRDIWHLEWANLSRSYRNFHLSYIFLSFILPMDLLSSLNILSQISLFLLIHLQIVPVLHFRWKSILLLNASFFDKEQDNFHTEKYHFKGSILSIFQVYTNFSF